MPGPSPLSSWEDGRAAVPIERTEDNVRVSRMRAGRTGFTLSEVLFVLLMMSVMLGIASQTYASYVKRTAARDTAQLFARDLTVARASAIRGRTSVVLAFDESARVYSVRTVGGAEVVHRTFGQGADIVLDEIDLLLPGDSVVFNSRGIADLKGSAGPLGQAVFRAGASVYAVSFNSMGASRLERK